MIPCDGPDEIDFELQKALPEEDRCITCNGLTKIKLHGLDVWYWCPDCYGSGSFYRTNL